MNLKQLSSLKRWHVDHRDDAPLEYHAWDLVLTLWVLGWMGVAPALFLHWQWALPVCCAFFFSPPLYVRIRRRLHERGALRCDWLPALARA
jgi:hypothetical protein